MKYATFEGFLLLVVCSAALLGVCRGDNPPGNDYEPGSKQKSITCYEKNTQEGCE